MSHSSTYLKEAAIEFLQLCSGGKVKEAYEKFTAENFIHHNPYFKGDKQSLLTAMQESANENTGQVIEIKRALQDEDVVAVHSRISQNGEDAGISVVHMLRFEDNLIAEMWDVMMPEPMLMINENGLY